MTGWRFSVAVTRWSRSTQLRYTLRSGMGDYFGQVTVSLRNQPPTPTQPSIPLGSVNEYQLLLRRQRQVWLSPIADSTCVCAGKTVRSLENTCHTWALLRWWFTKRRYIKCTYVYLYMTWYVCRRHWEKL